MSINQIGLNYCEDLIGHNMFDICSLDFTVNRVFMKLFRTGNMEVVRDCQAFCNFDLPSVLLHKRTDKFISNY